MSQINFLPDSFLRHRRRQERRPVEFGVILATAGLLVLLWLYFSGPDAALARQAEQLDQEIERYNQLQAEQQRLEQQRAQLTRKLLIARETYQPIQTTQVLARLSELTPEPVRLVRFELSAQRPDPEAAPNADQRNKRQVRSRGEKQQDAPREPNRMRISLTGLAPTDDEIVVLIERLERDPVFSRVTLRNSRMTKTKTHFAREFSLELEIDLDRRFVHGDAGAITPGPRQGGPTDAD
ncbi:MAG: PilN domain-containing protein [Phycisphaeraceae bacterium]